VRTSIVRRVLIRSLIPPAPQRDTDTTWRQFLRTQASTTQASTMLACDFRDGHGARNGDTTELLIEGVTESALIVRSKITVAGIR
jgi:hypothetical protein